MDAHVVIVGGGIHGLSAALALRRRFPTRRLLIVDRWQEPLQLWKHRTKNCGTTFLRSPASHTIDEDFTSLLRFARKKRLERDAFIHPYFRPPLPLFQEHAENLIASHDIPSFMLQARVERLQPCREGWTLQTTRGTLKSQIVVLAVGSPEQAAPPGNHEESTHVFDSSFQTSQLRSSSVAVVGGGLTGVQTALLCAKTFERVELIHSEDITVAQFDSNPCFIGRACRGKFHGLRDYRERRRLIHAQRFPGTVPKDVKQKLDEAPKRTLNLHKDLALSKVKGGVTLKKRGFLAVDYTLYATGFSDGLPQAELVQSLHREEGFPLADCGFPIPRRHLEWGKSLYLMGALAELEIGPPARNIIGAHLALRSMLPALEEALR